MLKVLMMALLTSSQQRGWMANFQFHSFDGGLDGWMDGWMDGFIDDLVRFGLSKLAGPAMSESGKLFHTIRARIVREIVQCDQGQGKTLTLKKETALKNIFIENRKETISEYYHEKYFCKWPTK